LSKYKAFFKQLKTVVVVLFVFGGFSLSAQDIGVTNIEIVEGTLDTSAASKTYNLCSTETVTLNIGIRNFGTNPETITGQTIRLYITGVNSFAGGTVSYTATINPVTTIAAGAISTLTYHTNFSGSPPGLNFSNYGISTIVVSATSVSGTGDTNTDNDAYDIRGFVYTPTAPTLTVSPVTPEICVGDEIFFQISPAGGTLYKFYLNGSMVQSSTTDNTITFSSDPSDADSVSNGDKITIAFTDANGCVADTSTQSVTITVNGLPDATISSDAVSNQVCKGTDVTFTATGGTQYEFKVDGVIRQALSASSTFVTSAISDTSTVTVVAYNSNGCKDEASLQMQVLEVYNPGVITLQNAADSTICYGTVPTGNVSSTATASGTDVITYQWQSSINGSDWVNIDGETSVNYQPPALFQTTYFRRKALNTLGDLTCDQAPYTNVVDITVDPEFVINLATNNASNTFCIGDAVTVSAAAGAATYTFKINGVTTQASSTENLFLTVSTTTSAGTKEVSNGDTISVSVIDGNGCETTQSLSIIASASPLNPGLSTNAPGNIICSGDEIVITASGGDSYQFFINETPPAPGQAVGNVLTTSSLTDSSTIKVIASNSFGCSETATITVRVLSITDPGTIALSVATDTTICFGEEPAGVITSTLAASTSQSLYYQWQAKTVTGTWINIPSNANSPTYDPGVLNGTTSFRRLAKAYIDANGDGIPNDGKVCTSDPSSNIITITVNPAYVPNLSTGVAGDQFCSGDTISLSVAAVSGPATYTFTIEDSATRSQTSNVSRTFVTTAGNGGGLEINDGERVKIEVEDAAGCVYTEEIVISVSNFNTSGLAQITTNPADGVICPGESISFTALPVGPSYTYSFKLNGIAAVPSEVVTNVYTTSSIVSESTVELTVQDAAGCSASVTVTVYVPVLATAGAISATAADLTLCPGGTLASDIDGNGTLAGGATATLAGFSSAGATVTYQWQSRTGATWENIDGQTDADLPAGTVIFSQTTQLRRLAFAERGGSSCGSLPSNEITVQIDGVSTPGIDVSPSTTVCTDDAITLTGTGAVAGESYYWIIGGTTTSTTNPYNAAAGSIANGTTIQLYIIGSGGCTSTVVTEVITVADPPTIIMDSDAPGDTICAGESITITATDTTSPAGPATYTFLLNGIAAAPAEVVGNKYTTTNIVSESTVTVIIENASGCTETATMTILVPLLDTAGAISSTAANLSVCPGALLASTIDGNGTLAGGATATLAGFSSAGATVTYQWQSRTGATWENIDGQTDADLPAGVISFSETTNIRRLAYASLNGSQCGSLASNNITVVVSGVATPVIEINPGTTVCTDDAITLTGSGGGAGDTYTWVIGGTVTHTGQIYNAAAGSIADGATIQLQIVSSGGCTSTVVTEVITVVDPPAITMDSNASGNTICAGESISITATDTLNPAGPATYTFKLNGSPVDPAEVVGNVYTTTNITSQSIVSVIIENASGCTETSSMTIFVPSLSTGGTISATGADASGVVNVCKNDGLSAEIDGDGSGGTAGGTTATLAGFSSSGATVTYQWQRRFTPAEGWVDIPGETETDLDVGDISFEKTTYIRRLAYASLNGSDCGAVPSNVIKFEVEQERTPVIAPDPSLTICPSQEITFIGSGALEPGDIYNWSINAGAVTATGATYTAPAGSLIDGSTVQLTIVSAGESCTFTTSVEVNVEADPVIVLTSDASVPHVVCDGDNVVFTVTALASATSYEWKKSNVATPSSFIPFPGSPTAVNSITIPGDQLAHNDIIWVTINYGGGCSVTDSITLSMLEVTAGTVTGSQEICYGDIPSPLTNLTPATTNIAGATVGYRWEYSTDNFTSMVSDTGVTSFTYVFPGALLQTTQYRRVATASVSGSTACEIFTTEPIEVEVVQLSGGTVTPSLAAVCYDSGGLAPELSITGGSITGEYQWQMSTDNFTSNVTDVALATNATYTPSITTTQTTYYRRVVKKALLNGSTCQATSTIFRLEVNDLQPGTLDNSVEATLCYGSLPPKLGVGSSTPATSETATITYEWEFSTTGVGGWTAIAGTNDTGYQPDPLIATTYFRRSVSNTESGGTCKVYTNIVSITILDEIVPGSINYNAPTADELTLCSGDQPADLILTGATAAVAGSVTYTWESSTDLVTWSNVTSSTSNALLQFGAFNTPTVNTYYRVKISNGTITPTIPQSEIKLILSTTGNGVTLGEQYGVNIDGTLHEVTTTATINTMDIVGSQLASVITNDAPGYNATYYPATNIVLIDNYTAQFNTSLVSSGTLFLDMNIIANVSGGNECITYSDLFLVEFLEAPTITQTDGAVSSQEACIGNAIDTITFVVSGSVSQIRLNSLDDNFTVTGLEGATATVTTAVGESQNWTISGTIPVKFTVSGTPEKLADGSGFQILVDGECDDIFMNYTISVTPPATAPDVIMKDRNSLYDMVFERGGVWYNNSICQETDPIGPPDDGTPNNTFYTCYYNNSFNLNYNSFEWELHPPSAGTLSPSTDKQVSVIRLNYVPDGVPGTTTLTATETYSITIVGPDSTETHTEVTTGGVGLTLDQLGVALRNEINSDDDVSAVYYSSTNELHITADDAGPVGYFGVSVSNHASGSAFLQSPESIYRTGNSVEVDWDPNFGTTTATTNGVTATLRVRSKQCAATVTSSWLEVELWVVSEVVTATDPPDLRPPVALNEMGCGGYVTGLAPTCEVTEDSAYFGKSTQFFTAAVPGQTNDFGELEWDIINIDSSDSGVSSPGFLDTARGVISWNTGYYGSFDIRVRPKKCDDGSVSEDDWVSTTITIARGDDVVPTITGLNVPDCPTGTDTQTSKFISDRDVRWYVNNIGAIKIPGISTALTTLTGSWYQGFQEIETNYDSGDGDGDLELTWADNFEGTLFIKARPANCPGTPRNYAVVIPRAAEIVYDSGGVNQQVCFGSDIVSITYNIFGPNVIDIADNLPTGIGGTFTKGFQTSTLTFTDDFADNVEVGENYILTVNLTDYNYTVQVGENNIDDVGIGLAAAVVASDRIQSATYSSTGDFLELRGYPGLPFAVVATPPADPGCNISLPATNPVVSTYVISGTLSENLTAGQHTFTLTTISANASCTEDVQLLMMEVLESSTISVTSVSTTISQTVCEGTAITPIVYDIGGDPATVLVTGLPDGVSSTLVKNANPTPYELTISGLVNSDDWAQRVFTYEISTSGNAFGCGETTATGSITVDPEDHLITTSLATVTTQQICFGESIQPIIFEYWGPESISTIITGLPPGLDQDLADQNQIVDIDFGVVSATTNTNTYSVVVDEKVYSMTSSLGQTKFDVVNAIIAAIATDASAIVSATISDAARPKLRLTGNTAGQVFSVNISNTAGAQVIVAAPEMITGPKKVTISGIPTASSTATFNYTVSTNGSCEDSPIVLGPYGITVSPDPTITLTSSASTIDQFICENSAIVSITYDLGNGATDIIVSGLPAGLDWTPKIGVITNVTIFGTPIVDVNVPTAYRYSITTTNTTTECNEATVYGIININPDETEAENAIDPPSNVTLCQNEYVDLEFGFIGVSALSFTASTVLPAGLIPTTVYTSKQSVVISITGTSTAAIDQSYKIQVEEDGGLRTYEYKTLAPNESAVTIATGLLAAFDDPRVTDTASGTTQITLEAKNDAYIFGIRLISNQVSGATMSVVASTPVQGTLSITGTPTTVVTVTTVHTISVETPGTRCTSSTATVTLTLNPVHSLTASGTATTSQTVCDNTAIDEIYISYGGGATNIQTPISWRNITEGNNNPPNGIINPYLGTVSGTGIKLSGTIDTTNGGAVAGITTTTVWTYTVTTTGNVCDPASLTGTITVEPIHGIDVALGLGSGAKDQEVCDNGPLDNNIVFQLTGGATAYEFSWDPFGGPGLDIIFDVASSTITISGTVNTGVTTPTAYTYTISTTGNFCGTVTETGTITVNPATASITLTSGASTNNQFICEGDSITPIVYTFAGGATGATVDDLPPGVVIQAVTTNTITIGGDPTENVKIPTNYRYSVTTEGSSCNAITTYGFITLNPREDDLITQITGDTQICQNQYVDIKFEFEGVTSLSLTPSTTLPNGLSATTSYTVAKQEFVVTLTGNSTTTAEIYKIQIVEGTGVRSYQYATTTNTLTAANIATQLQAVISDAQVNATVLGNQITLSSVNDGYVFGVRLIANSGVNMSVSSSTPVKGIYSIVGTPTTVVTETTTYDIGVQTPGTLCDSGTSTITLTLDPVHSVSLTSTDSTQNQTICDDSPLTNIVFDIGGGADGYIISWDPVMPAGINGNPPIAGTTITLSGTPDTGVTTTTVYTYTVTTTGGVCDSATITGSITLLPKETISLAGGSGAKNQTVCNSSGLANPIVFQLTGGATNYEFNWDTTSPGLTVSFDATALTVTISGTANASGITETTNYGYTINTLGNGCGTSTETGIITVNPLSSITVSGTNQSQIGSNGVCGGSEIDPIEFTVSGGATSAQISWTTPGLAQAGLLLDNKGGGVFSLQGIVTTTNTTPTLYTYTITTVNANGCLPEDSFNGVIEVYPVPTVDANYIQTSDFTASTYTGIRDVTCFGGNDGVISIQTEPLTELDKAITGGQLSARQHDYVTISHSSPTLNLLDAVTISVNGVSFEHIVTNVATATILNELASDINSSLSAVVYASQITVSGEPTLSILSQVPGLAFTTTVGAISSTIVGATTVLNNVTANNTTGYSLTLRAADNTVVGTNMFTVTTTPSVSYVSFPNLSAGDYTLNVSINNCDADPVTLTVGGPTAELEIETSACDSAILVDITGGTSPYTIYLLRNVIVAGISTNVIVDTETANGTASATASVQFLGLTPSEHYLVQVYDKNCSIPAEETVIMPLELDYDPLKTRVVNDYCKESPNVGGGSIELNTNSGNAFSGGSGIFSYRWTATIGGNPYTNNSMNITDLLPGNYSVTVTDEVLGCSTTKVFEIKEPSELSLDKTGGVAPSVVTGGSATPVSSADWVVDIGCTATEAVLEVQATGGLSAASTGTANYTYSWTRNGSVYTPDAGAGNRVTTTQEGIYQVTVALDLSSADVPYLKNLADLSCTKTMSFEVRKPNPYVLVEDRDNRVEPACDGDKATLVFNIVGGTSNSHPYSLSIEGGTLTGSAGADRIVTITNIDTSIISTIQNYVITDGNGCSTSGVLSSTISLPVFAEIAFQADKTDIDCSAGTLGTITLSVATGSLPADLSGVQIQVKGTSVNFNYYTTWASANDGSGNAVISISEAGTYNYIISSSSSCVLSDDGSGKTGSIDIEDAGNNQLVIRDIEVTQPGCNSELGMIELVFEEATIVPPLSIIWKKRVSTTFTASGSTTPTISTDWVELPSLEGNAIIEVETGAYKAFYSDDRQDLGDDCKAGVKETNIIVVGGGDVLIQNLVTSRQSAIDCSDPNNILYDVDFDLQNNTIDNGNETNFEVTLTKVGGANPNAYANTFDTATTDANFSSPGTLDKTGHYKITDIPSGEYVLLVSQVASTTTETICEIDQYFIIGDIEKIEWTGSTSVTLDPCTQVADISASITGGVPWINSAGDPFYKYLWTFTPSDGGISTNYTGDSVSLSEEGELSLTVWDSLDCETDVTASASITVQLGYTPFRFEPKIPIDADGDGVPESLGYSVEPSCLAPAKDDGQIGFTVEGGIQADGSQAPYQVIWEKFDEASGAFVLLDGVASSPSLTNQDYSNELVSGTYRITIQPIGISCGATNLDVQKVIKVDPNKELYIIEGPMLDGNLCLLEPGFISITLFNNLQDEVYFYYNGDLIVTGSEDFVTQTVTVTSGAASGSTITSTVYFEQQRYNLAIENPEESAILKIVNSNGCVIEENIIIEDITPNFEYTSISLTYDSPSNSIYVPAREEVSFTDLSTGPYISAEWNFGDGSDTVMMPANTTSPVTHEYGISGTYTATLIIRNQLGCPKYESVNIKVGKGWSILAPNVFTPNSPPLNERFKPISTGLKNLVLTIYDYRGNLIYTESKPENTTDALENRAETDPLYDPTKQIIGWDGKLNGVEATHSPYYIYTATGETNYGEQIPVYSGTFIIIR